MGLTTVENLRGHESFEVLLIRGNVDRMHRSFEVVTPMFEAFDNGEHFVVTDIMIAFRGNALA